jgi:PQQ-dependent catabolism-associated CXXCW motif protein
MKIDERAGTRTHPQPKSVNVAIIFLFLASIALPALAQQGFDQPPSAYPSQQPPAGVSPAQQAPQSGVPYNAMPAQPAFTPANGAPSGYGNTQGSGAGGQPQAMQALLQQEMQDFGVQPLAQLQTSLHGPTPTSIPGGQVITTDRLLGLYQQGDQSGLLVFHVLGPGPTLPNAQNAAPASQAGSFADQTQQEFGQYLQQVTQGNKARPMVFYCLNIQCWMSYNAALRAINMGFTNVLWYRGGIEAWQQAQQLASGMQAPPQGAPAPAGYR